MLQVSLQSCVFSAAACLNEHTNSQNDFNCCLVINLDVPQIHVNQPNFCRRDCASMHCTSHKYSNRVVSASLDVNYLHDIARIFVSHLYNDYS